jgi:acetyl esterase/lipase
MTSSFASWPSVPGARSPSWNTRPHRRRTTPSLSSRATPDPAQRTQITASPNTASAAQLTGLPPALLLVDEADVLRDEGEAYAAKLRAADVPVTAVRYDGTVHDFMLLNALSQTLAARAAIDQANMFLRRALGT